MTAELLADLEQWARLTGKLASHGGAARELRPTRRRAGLSRPMNKLCPHPVA
jgi:hypothetical protein